jgi:hypothetical protein
MTHDNCPNCVNWQTDIQHGCLQYKPPKDYLEDQIPLSGKLTPFKLSYDVLKAAVVLAQVLFVWRLARETFEKLSAGTWAEQ